MIIRIFLYLIFCVPALYPAWWILHAMEHKMNKSEFVAGGIYVVVVTCIWILVVASFTLFKIRKTKNSKIQG